MKRRKPGMPDLRKRAAAAAEAGRFLYARYGFGLGVSEPFAHVRIRGDRFYVESTTNDFAATGPAPAWDSQTFRDRLGFRGPA